MFVIINDFVDMPPKKQKLSREEVLKKKKDAERLRYNVDKNILKEERDERKKKGLNTRKKRKRSEKTYQKYEKC